MSDKAIILFSGGLDSTTCLYWAKAQGWQPVALSFDYGQRHSVELAAAGAICAQLNVPHYLQSLPIGKWLNSSLTGVGSVPKKPTDGIPSTYVPARNTIFLSIALGLAESLGATKIVFGANHIDYSGYPDCRPEYIEAFNHMARLATKAGVEGQELQVVTPLLQLNKAQIVELAVRLGVPTGLTRSCYDPDADGKPCGACDSCRLRAAGFHQAGKHDVFRVLPNTKESA